MNKNNICSKSGLIKRKMESLLYKNAYMMDHL